LESLQPEVVSATAGKLVLRCRSEERILEMVLCLNFASERLEFDPERGAGIRDDGSIGAAEKALGLLGFIRGLYSNGELEVWESDRQMLLGRCDAYIPVNVDLLATDRAFEQMAVKVTGKSNDGRRLHLEGWMATAGGNRFARPRSPPPDDGHGAGDSRDRLSYRYIVAGPGDLHERRRREMIILVSCCPGA
jgi:hypothetical protein